MQFETALKRLGLEYLNLPLEQAVDQDADLLALLAAIDDRDARNDLREASGA